MRDLMRRFSVGGLRNFLLGNRLRTLVLTASTLILVLGGTFFGIEATRAASFCSVTYTVTSQWPGSPGGFNVQAITITNTSGTAWTSWTLTFTFPAAGQSVQANPWNGNFTQSGQNVTVTNASYNGSVANNASVNPAPGFNGNWTTSNPIPTNFAVNGNACNGTGGNPTATPTQSGNTPTSTPTGNTPTATPTRTSTSTPVPTSTPTGPTATPCSGNCGRVTNPYVGATGYINPQWASEVKAGAATKSGTLARQEAEVANFSTAVWLDSKAAVTGSPPYTMSLINHLDAAETQAASSSQPIVIEFVIYDLPGRDCAALASNGEEPATAAGLTDYETNYINPIAAAFGTAKYSNLRIVAIIEPDSLPNMVTNLNYTNPNTGQQTCATVNNGGYYVNGVQYALNKLSAISNVYNFVDIGHSGWLGWSSNFNPAVTLIGNVIKGTTKGVNSVSGFIDNTANYQVVQEPYMTANESIGGNPVRSATFYQWNTYIEELEYAQDWATAMLNSGFNSNNVLMLIDTSRDGWGGPNRPTGASTSTDLNTFVNASRINQQIGRGNWCNQPGGIGARPAANPITGIAAFVWIKPPGESDGSSTAIPPGPQNPTGKGFDRMCDPTYGGNQLNNNVMTGAMPNAPVSGAWFQAGFDTLVTNAFPPLP
jgi:cellulose 1,4-beta-cellobiosidase